MAGSSEALVIHALLCCLCGGVASIECSGRVWIEPAPMVLMGSNISINCLATPGCPRAEFFIFLNYSLVEGPLHPVNSSTVQLWLHDFQEPFRTVACFTRCPNSKRSQLVCGANIQAGYPPDPPSNLTCTIRERSGHLACTWDRGRLTHLSTHYTLHLRRTGLAVVKDAEEKDAEEKGEEEEVFPAGSPVPLSTLHGRSRYSAWVQASNALGTARSAPRPLDLQELVVPTPPLVDSAETTETSPPTTIIHWRRQTLLENVHCQVPAQPCRQPLEPLEPPFLYTTPEAAPATAPDVWRRLGPAFPNGSHEVTVLIKPLSPQDARGRILGYTVAAESPWGTLLLCNTSSTVCSILVPPGAHTLRITAYNSKGASSPASITLSQGAGSQEEFPAPVAVEVKPDNLSRVLVAWQPSPRSSRSPLWFIVEGVSTTWYGWEEQYFWKKVPHQETHTYIRAKAVAGGHINVSVYAVYPDGVSRPSSGQVPAEDQLLGSTSSEISHDGDIGVLLGLGISVVTLSVGFVILMSKKSARKRINATVVSLLPKWLSEDFPHMENSSVVKALQEKSDSTSDSFYEPFLDSSDPMVTEIEEVPVHEEDRNMVTRRKPSREVPEDGQHPGSTAPANIVTPEQISDYKPQVSDGNPLGYVAANIYPSQPPAALPEPEMNTFFRDYTSPVPNLWDGEGGEHPICLLEKINLILNSSRSGQSHVFDSAQGGHGSLPGHQWGLAPAGDVQEQMLVPDELVSCLKAMNGEPVDIKTCFPQSIGRSF